MRRSGPLLGIVLAWALLLPLPVTAQAETDLESEVERPLTEAIWSAAVLQQVLAERDYPTILSLALLNRSSSAAETLSATLASTPPARLRRCRGLEDPVEGTLCSLETLVPLLPPDQRRLLTEEGARLLDVYLQPGETLAPGVAGIPSPGPVGGDGRRFAPLQTFAQGVVEEALRRHTADSLELEEFEGIDRTDSFSATLAGIIGFTPDDGAARILAQVPELGTLLRSHPGLASLEVSASGTLQATRLEGQAILLEYRSFLSSVTGSAQGLLEDPFVESLPELISVATPSSAVDWASQRAFVYLATRTASLSGVEDGVTRRIHALGNAAADLRQEGYAFRRNFAELGQQAATAALTGNVFTLASGVATFFQLNPASMGPSAADEMRALRGLVDDLRGEVSAGFEEVDARFDDVMETLDQRFGRMETLVARNHREVLGELSAMGQELAALGGRMDRMDANLVAYLQAGFDRDYTRTLIRCLEHRERHLPPFDQMEFGVFSECLTDFRARGTRDARDALLTDRTTPVDDRSLETALADDSPANLARRLPLIARAAEQRLGESSMRGGRDGANPVEWAVASQAYLTLLQDWPEYARGVAPGDLEALLATGLETQAVLQGIEGVMDRVLLDYERGVATLTEEADHLARRYQQAQLLRVDPSTLLNRVTPEVSDRPILQVPRHVGGRIPSEVRTAAVLGLEEPVLVYRTVSADSISTQNLRRRWLFFGRRHDRLIHTRTRLEMELQVGEGEVVARYRTRGPMTLHRIEEMAGEVGSDRVRSTDVQVADPELHFLETHLPDLISDPTAWETTPPDPAVLRRLERDIEAELRRYESTSLNRVFQAVCQAGPMTTELEGPDRISAERIHASVERLTSARLLLGASARLTLPNSAADDPALQRLLFSDDGLLDRGALCRVVAAGDSPLRLVWLEQEPLERANLLTRALAEARAREHAEGRPPSMVDATIQQLRAAIRLQRIRAQVAG